LKTVLETESLVKRFGPRVAVDGLSLRVREGEIYGFLGVNGAGKTTAIRLMLGLAKPDSGRVMLFGESQEGNRRALRRVGFLSDAPGFYENLTARENLRLHAMLSGVIGRSAVDDALGAAGIAEAGDARVSGFSLGMKRRLGVARAILNHPELLILDEPINGLDPAGIRDLRALLARLACENGVAVFMSSHILAEVEQVADRVGVIHGGKLIDESPIDELRQRIGSYLVFEVSDDARAAVILERDLGLTDFEIPSDGIVRVLSRDVDAASINRAFVVGGVEVSRVAREGAGLEEYFFDLTGGNHV
jgi:bacitracin transport system ATP-binding protein